MLRLEQMCLRGAKGQPRQCYMVLRVRITSDEEQKESVYAQDLHEAEDGDAMVFAEDGDKVVEEPGWPGDFGEDEEDALEDDEQVVDDREHGATWLKRNTRGVESQFKLLFWVWKERGERTCCSLGSRSRSSIRCR